MLYFKHLTFAFGICFETMNFNTNSIFLRFVKNIIQVLLQALCYSLMYNRGNDADAHVRYNLCSESRQLHVNSRANSSIQYIQNIIKNLTIIIIVYKTYEKADNHALNYNNWQLSLIAVQLNPFIVGTCIKIQTINI